MKKNIFLKLVLIITCHILQAQEPKLILPIGHFLGVGSAFSPDGKRVVTSGLDNIAKIWEAESGRLLANLRGHTDTLSGANFSPNGKKIITASEDGTVKIWDAVSTILLTDIQAHDHNVYVAEFSPDGKKIVTASTDGIAKIWDVATGKILADLRGHTKAIWWAWFSRDGKKIITASDDSTAKIWDVDSGKKLTDLKGHASKIFYIEFSPDGKKVITGSEDSTAKIWDAVTGMLLKDIKQHQSPVRVVHFSPDGKKLVTASDNGDVKLWNAETFNLIANIKGKQVLGIKPGAYFKERDIARAADFSPDGKKLITVYLDSVTRIWDVVSGKLLVESRRENVYVNNVSVSRDGEKFSLGLASGNAQIYDVNKGSLLADLKGGANYIQRFSLSPDGKRILVSNWYGSAKILNAETGTLVANLSGKKNSPYGVEAIFSPDGKKIAVKLDDNKAEIRDAITGTLLYELTGHLKSIIHVIFSPDGKKIVTVSRDSTLKIWDVSKGVLLADLKGQVAVSNFFNFSLDGEKIVTTSGDTTAKVWETHTGKLLITLIGHTQGIQKVEFGLDGKKILTYSRDNTAKIWNAETGDLLTSIKEPFNRIRWAKLTPDGKKIILTTFHSNKKNAVTKILDVESGIVIAELSKQIQSGFAYDFSPDRKHFTGGTEDGSIITWDLETGKLLKEMKGHSESVNGIRYSPDGKKIVSNSHDGTAKIWNAETGALLLDLKEHTFWLNSANFSPDGKKVITVSQDHTAKVWDAETGSSLYTFISVGKEDYLVLDKYNHFDGTEGARKLLYFTCGTEIIELEQLKDQLWVPNLSERILNGETINAAKLSDLNVCNLTPVVDTIGQTALKYRFRITPRLGGLGATIVYVNGIEVKRYTPQQLVPHKKAYELVVDKKDVEKFFIANRENNITVKSLTAKYSISSRSVSIYEKGNEKNAALPNLYAIVVGVSDYKGESLDLKFADKDAADMADAIGISARKLLNTDSKEHVFIYKVHTANGRDKFPEKNSIRLLFGEISAKAQPNDILLIFFAGHGVLESEKNQFYFLTADASNVTVSGALKNVAISMEELAEWIKPQVMKAQKRILIFDACNSGQAVKEMSFNQTGQNLLAARNDDKGKQVKAIEKLNEKSGMFILSASASDQKAYEMGKYNQGVLTYSLLKAIKEQPDILEERKYLNISRWFNSAEKIVNELTRETGARQQPQLVSTTNFNIGVVDEEVRNKIVLPFEKSLFTRSDFRNTETAIDNLKLRNLVDKELIDLSDENGTSVMYSSEYEGQNVYQLSGSYTVIGNSIKVITIITKGGTEIKTKFETGGMINDLPGAAKQIMSFVIDWQKKNKQRS